MTFLAMVAEASQKLSTPRMPTPSAPPLEPEANLRVVAKFRYPISCDALTGIVKTTERIYGKGLMILTDHPDAAEWMVLAQPEKPPALAASTGGTGS